MAGLASVGFSGHNLLLVIYLAAAFFGAGLGSGAEAPANAGVAHAVGCSVDVLAMD